MNISRKEIINYEKSTQVKDIVLSENYCEYFSQEYISNKGHTTKISEYNTDVSVAYLNQDNIKTFYVFSAPIQIKQGGEYVAIDTRIKRTTSPMYEKQGCSYCVNNNDIKVCFNKVMDWESGILVAKDNFKYEILSNHKKAYGSN